MVDGDRGVPRPSPQGSDEPAGPGPSRSAHLPPPPPGGAGGPGGRGAPAWPTPATWPEPPPARRRGRAGRRGRPAFGAVVGLAVAVRFGREIVERAAWSRYGGVGLLAVAVAAVAVIVGWRMVVRARVRARGGVEFTPEVVARQIADSELGGPAFPEDGTLLGASILVVNQRPKVLEARTEYQVFGSGGDRIGAIDQVGQSRAKLVARVFTGFDQYFTHHFEVRDRDGRPVLRMTRPRKLFLTKLHVFAGDGRPLGTIKQQNVFWKIRFGVTAAGGALVAQLRAENLRAWDFTVYDTLERPVATVVKSWEGWGRTAFTRADHYVVRIHVQLPEPLRQLVLAAALAADVALKQDARGIL